MSTDITGRVLTYVEVDLDVYRITRFEAATNGVSVPNWVLSQGANTAFVGAINSALPSGRGARFTKTSSSADTVWKWSIPPNIADASVVALLRHQAGTEDMGVVVRHTATGTGYLLRLNNDDLEIRKGTGSGWGTLLNTIDFPITAAENIWLRFDAITIGANVLLRAKAWRGVLSDEPALFTTFVDDTSGIISAAGPAGLYTFSNSADFVCGHFRVRSLLGSAIETVRHAMPSDYLPLAATPAIPDVMSAAVQPGELSLGESLGKRSQLSVVFKEHLHADLGELYSSGTHWARFRGRQLFRRGQPLRLIRGLLGQTLAEMETRHFVLEDFDGPTPQGGFTLTAQDVLKLADNDRAQAPVISDGFLSGAITNSATSATLLPSGIGNAQYPASGHVAIGGEEVCSFTRSGDNLTLTRGLFGTTAVAHSAEDRVQLCLHFNAQDPADIISDLLTNYAGIDSANIPLTTWQQETDTYLQRLYTRLIAEPTGVNKLVSELIEQAGLAVWPDEKANLIRLQVLRGIPTTAFLYDQHAMLEGSLRTQEQRSKQITQIWTYYGVRNPLEPLDDPSNYRSTLSTIDTEGETLNGQAIIRKVFGTWIPAFARTTAKRINDIQIGRFATPPRRIAFDVLRYSGVQEPERGGGYRATWWGNQDEAGEQISAPIQVTRVTPLADRFQVESEEMLFKQFDPDDLTNRSITIDSNINNVHLPSLHNAIYPPLTPDDVTAGVNLTVIINTGVKVGSASTSTRAFDVGGSSDWPASFPITIVVKGKLQGAGGQGGIVFPPGPVDGRPGGPALYTRFPIDLTDTLGEIWGGAGGGGHGTVDGFNGGSGGGGAGLDPGPPGEGGGSPASTAGTETAGGAGGRRTMGSVTVQGGVGGGPGLPGVGGGQLGVSPLITSGGAAGPAIDGISFVTTVGAPGDRRGPTVN